MNLFIVGCAGLVGTSIMLALMSVLHRLKLANADMVRAIGSLYTRTYADSVLPGLLIQYTFGVVFAYAYASLIRFSPVVTPSSTVILATFVGLVHGIVVGLALEVMVAVYHPVKQFRKAGFAVVVAHIVGHISYGLSLGIVYAAFLEPICLAPLFSLQ